MGGRSQVDRIAADGVRAMKSRRQALEALGACVLIAPLAAIAQSNKVYRVGWISLGQPGAPSPFLDAFRQGLKERGYIEGKNLFLDARLADGSRDRADQMVVALVQSKVDIIVTQGGAAWSAYRHAGTTPVVIGYSGDPVEAKFVKSLAQPGGTLTGMSFLALELVGKRLELLAQILPPGSRVAIIADPEHPGEQTELRQSRVAAQNVGMKLSYFPVRSPEELDAAFKTISSETAQAIVVFPDAFTLDQRTRIAAFGLKYRLPIVSGWSEYAESGFLMTYGPNLRASYAHLAIYVDRILRGARPADLPVELPTSVEFVVNAKTAKAIGVTIPQPLLLRANEVIQ
jgi:putative ABC transport system substrate-binding protein